MLDFNSTAAFRNEILRRNLQKPYGRNDTLPINFTSDTYSFKRQSDVYIKHQESIDERKAQDLLNNTHKNKFKPDTYTAYESLTDATLNLSQRGLYPLFNPSEHTFSSIMRSNNFEQESDMMKKNVTFLRQCFLEKQKQLKTSPTDLRITVNPDHEEMNLLDLIEGNQKPEPDLPNDYYTYIFRRFSVGGILQNLTEINTNIVRNPSITYVRYMGKEQRNMLFEQLRYSKYIPLYTLGSLDAPIGRSYIGTGTVADEFLYSQTDIHGRIVRGAEYLYKSFNEYPVKQPNFNKSFENDHDITGGFTWKSRSINNPVGSGNKHFSSERSDVENSYSTNYSAREDSIMDTIQKLLDSAPKGGSARSHVGNAIDQTSRIFHDGEKFLSKGSAIKYVDKFNKTENGAEYARVWTKDRPYTYMSDLQKTKGNIRKFTTSVLNSPFNLNIAPQNGSNNFEGSSNIERTGNGFRAKKYMFSIENLAWKTSNRYGFRYDDLPYCERGSNGGRVMWFPPYALTVTDNNSSKWNDNQFLGRIEPIYTYSGAERSGTLSFKIVVDHPSVLNLLVRKRFHGMADAEINNYIQAFFSGVENVDIYDLAKKYSQLDKTDLEKILAYLNGSKGSTEVITRWREVSSYNPQPDVVHNDGIFKTDYVRNTTVYFPHNDGSGDSYDSVYASYVASQSAYLTDFETGASTAGMSVSATTGNETKINNAFTQLTQNYNDLRTMVADVKKGLDSGNYVTVYLYGGTSLFEDNKANVSKSRTKSVEKYIVGALGLQFEENKSKYEYEYKENQKVYKTTLEILEVFLEDNHYSAEAGVNCNNEAVITAVSTNGYLDQTLSTNFYCRSVGVSVSQVPVSQEEVAVKDTKETKKIKEEIVVDTPPIPQLDEVKRILMKLLSENYYFDALEEDSPMVFSNLKEKLKYFHPAFHSMTPEGLNARLTFLLQCTRCGDTIPTVTVDGDKTITTGRNTAFGSPPICILRVGDMYHSKVLIRDVNISYDDNGMLWDMNPEGIGLQPMIATVNISLTFIGGQGLKEPVAELQNALSSNFFANTEMYDYRSTATEDKEKFNKEFLQELLDSTGMVTEKDVEVKPEQLFGEPIGKIISYDVNSSNLASGRLGYTDIINQTYGQLDSYGKTYTDYFNKVYGKWGKTIASIAMAQANRQYYSGTFISTSFNLAGIPLGLGSKINEIVTDIAADLKDLNFDVFQKINNQLTANQKNTYQTNFTQNFQTAFINAVTAEIERDIKTSEDALFTAEKSLSINIDKLNFVNDGSDGLVNKDGVREFTLSGATSGNMGQFFSPYISQYNTFYSSVQAKLDNTAEASITENTAYRKYIMSTYLKKNMYTFLNLFEVDDAKKRNWETLLREYGNFTPDASVIVPATPNKAIKTVEYGFTENPSKPDADTLKKIFSTQNLGSVNAYNFTKMQAP